MRGRCVGPAAAPALLGLGLCQLKRSPWRADPQRSHLPLGAALERRNHPRFRTRFDVLCSAGDVEGAGILKDISRSGACLTAASHVPELGTKVRLYIFIQPICPFELAGEVVRCEEGEFAIQYSNLDSDVGRLVDDVAALVTGP